MTKKKLTREQKIIEAFKVRQEFREWVATMADMYLVKCDRKGKDPDIKKFLLFIRSYERTR